MEPAFRVGVVVPPDNAVVEPELVSALSGKATVHTARLQPARDRAFRARLEHYAATFEETVDQLIGLLPEAVVVACTGASYLVGPAEDERRGRQLSGEFGIPVRSIASCVRETLRELEVRRIALLSPYPAWLTAECARYWREYGIDVLSVRQVPGASHPYQLSANDVDRELGRVLGELHPEAQALLVTGTGVRTLEVLRHRQPASPVPLLSSASCGVSWLEDAVSERRRSGSAAGRRQGSDERK